jgi:hypothetical protein
MRPHSDTGTNAEALSRYLDTLSYRKVRRLLKEQPRKYPRFLYKFRRLQTPDDVKLLREIVVGI